MNIYPDISNQLIEESETETKEDEDLLLQAKFANSKLNQNMYDIYIYIYLEAVKFILRGKLVF